MNDEKIFANLIDKLKELDSLYIVRFRDNRGGIIEIQHGNSYKEIEKTFKNNDLEVINIIKLTDLSHGDEIVLLP